MSCQVKNIFYGNIYCHKEGGGIPYPPGSSKARPRGRALTPQRVRLY